MRNAFSSRSGHRLLSRTAEHALRATLYLGRLGDSVFVSAGQVAEALGTPPNYTSKTLRQLARRGILSSLRGPGGGFSLRVGPSELTVARVLDAVDDAVEAPKVCLLGDRPCDGETPCAAHLKWAEVQDHATEILERTTLADLLGDKTTRDHDNHLRHAQEQL